MEVGRPDRGALIRAFYENLCFAIRGNSEQIAAVAGRPISRLRVSGGMSRSPILMQILADVMDGTLEVAGVAESAGLGCAILGAVGLGAYPGVESAATAMVRSVPVAPRAIGSYAEQYAKWRELYAALETLTV
jgi:sugar (pentulose or hexulose) kinase